MDSSALQGLGYISMASNNSLLPRAIFNPVPCVSIWEGSMATEGESGPQLMLQPTENRVNQDEGTNDR